MRRLAPVLTASVLACSPSSAGAQDAPPQLTGNPVPNFIAALSFLSLSEDISGATYHVHNGNEFEDDTRFSTIKLPWEHDFDVGSELGTLFLEAGAGYLHAEDRFRAATPEGDLTLEQDWKALAARVGAGFTFELSETWKLRPSIGAAYTDLENEATYSPLAEEELAPLLDGEFVNWDAKAVTSAASLTGIHENQFGDVSVLVRGRYSFLYTDVFSATSSAQAQDDVGHIVTFRSDVEGPTPWSAFQRPIQWMAFGAYASLLGTADDSLQFNDLFEVGVGARIPLPKLLDSVLVSGAILFGPDISGSTIGLSVAF